MAGCTPFTLEVEDDLESRLANVKSGIESSGGRFAGDLKFGTFSGNVPLLGSFQGQYEVTGSQVTITITDKPFLVSCHTAESKIRDYFR